MQRKIVAVFLSAILLFSMTRALTVATKAATGNDIENIKGFGIRYLVGVGFLTTGCFYIMF